MSKPPSTCEETVGIVVDSNALFAPLQFKIDIFSELERVLNKRFELILLSPVHEELETLTVKGSPKIRKMATFALNTAQRFKHIKTNFSSKTVDDAIIEFASKCKTPVFTNDSQLRKRLRDISVPVIYLRQKSRLDIDGLIS